MIENLEIYFIILTAKNQKYFYESLMIKQTVM